MSDILFTGRTFPEKVFNIDFKKVIVFEFDVLFSDVFAKKLTEFCTTNNFDFIEVESLDKQYLLKEKLSGDIMNRNYITLLKNKFIPEEFPKGLTYYTLLSNFIIYSSVPRFAFYANRDFDVGILAYNTGVDVTMFKDLTWGIKMKDLFEKLKFHKINSVKITSQFEGKEYFF